MPLEPDNAPKRFSIVQDINDSGNWLALYDDGIVGYWPKELFTHLKDGATFVKYGGSAFESINKTRPAMGNGSFPSKIAEEYNKSAFFAHCQYSNAESEGVLVDISAPKVYPVTTFPLCYETEYFLTLMPELGQMFAYGGSGGDCRGM
ncbi:PREDICTED: uncharacterized protein LOC104817417 [Tarenaya hassleriana]|uniref:uncharacterized protein LOC104817417 n=1 Tax=Tarenaya hassleriana TaxID=28532 RepID=UPI00053C5397|nr:PREDICTED: uncharacterized protein LOC104817417 [Tarenaya hassleriana]XP_010544913.1 PREDICTED: uncharacterized protein LOC104817417 [Tarenaya hassleriana]